MADKFNRFTLTKEVCLAQNSSSDANAARLTGG